LELGRRALARARSLAQSILFGLFTAAMLADQLGSILSDTTAIERLKKEASAGARAESESCLLALSETFGRPCSLTWLLPTSVRFNGLTYEQLSSTDMLYALTEESASRQGHAHHRHGYGDRHHCDHDHGYSDEGSDSDGGGAPLSPRYATHSSGTRAVEGEYLAPRHAVRYMPDAM
jgi:hypothetical protein